MMTGPMVWNRASLRAADYSSTVKPRQAAACLRIRNELRRRESVDPADFRDRALAGEPRNRAPSVARSCACSGLLRPISRVADEERRTGYSPSEVDSLFA